MNDAENIPPASSSSEPIAREFSRNEVCPPLEEASIRLLTDLIFPQDTIGSAPLIFCFGSHLDFDAYAATMHKALSNMNQFEEEHGWLARDSDGNLLPKIVVISGGRPKYEGAVALSEPESDTIKRLYETIHPAHKYPIEFVLETEAAHSQQNVMLSMKLLRARGIELSDLSAILSICEMPLAGRQLLYLAKFAPQTQRFVHSYVPEADSEGKLYGRDNWHATEQGRNRVWSEVNRIVYYGLRGDLDLEPVREQVKEVLSQLHLSPYDLLKPEHVDELQSKGIDVQSL